MYKFDYFAAAKRLKKLGYTFEEAYYYFFGRLPRNLTNR